MRTAATGSTTYGVQAITITNQDATGPVSQGNAASQV